MFIFLLWQSFDFRSIRVDSPLLLIVNGKKQNVHSQIATSISCKPHREWPKEDASSFCSRGWKHKDGFITTPSYTTKVLLDHIVRWWHHEDSEAEEHYQLSIIRSHFLSVWQHWTKCIKMCTFHLFFPSTLCLLCFHLCVCFGWLNCFCKWSWGYYSTVVLYLLFFVPFCQTVG